MYNICKGEGENSKIARLQNEKFSENKKIFKNELKKLKITKK